MRTAWVDWVRVTSGERGCGGAIQLRTLLKTRPTPPVIPADAGTHGYGGPGDTAPSVPTPRPWVPAYAGMTGGERVSTGGMNRPTLSICKVFESIERSKPQAPHSSQTHPIHTPLSVIPADAGTHGYGGPGDIAPSLPAPRPWVPAFAGMTGQGERNYRAQSGWRAPTRGEAGQAKVTPTPKTQQKANFRPHAPTGTNP